MSEAALSLATATAVAFIAVIRALYLVRERVAKLEAVEELRRHYEQTQRPRLIDLTLVEPEEDP